MAPPDPVLGPRWFTGARLNFAENLLRRYDDARGAGAVDRARTRGDGSRTPSSATRWRDSPDSCEMRASWRAIASSASSRTCRRPSSRCSPPRRSARCGRRARRTSDPPACSIASARSRRRCWSRRTAIVWAGKRIDCLDRVRAFLPSLPSVEQVVVVPHLPRRSRRRRRAAGWRDRVGRCARALRGRRCSSFDPAAVRSPALHHVLVGDDGPAEVHGARCRRHARAAPEGARAARRPARARPDLLLHDLRVDDVELARLEPGASARRSCCTMARPLLRDRTILWDLVAEERLTVFGTSAKWLALAEKEGLRAASDARPVGAADHPVHRKPARRAQLRLRLSAREARRAPQQHQRRHGHHLLFRAVATRSCPCIAARSRRAGYGMNVDVFDEHGRSVSRARGRARVHGALPEHAGGVLERSRRRRSTARRTSTSTPTCGGTATGRSSRRTTA